MFESVEEQLLEREMMKIIKQFQLNIDIEKNQEVKVQNGQKDKEINIKSQNKEVEKVNKAVGDEEIDWEQNYLDLMQECGYQLPDEEINTQLDNENEKKINLMIQKNDECHNRDFAQYKLQPINNESDDQESEEVQKSKQMMNDLHDEEEQIMTPEQQKEYFKSLRSKYLNVKQVDEQKQTEKSVDTTAYATNESDTTQISSQNVANNQKQQPLLEEKQLEQTQNDDQGQLKQNDSSQIQKQNENSQSIDKPRSLLPQDHVTLTREMYDEQKKQQKALKKAIQNAKDLGIVYNGVINFENFDETSSEEGEDQNKLQDQEQDEQLEDNNVIEEQDEDEYDENNDQTTQDEQVNVLTEIKREYIQTNKWNCKEYKIFYSNEDIYEGEIDDKTSLKDGWGVYLYANGEKYEGFFQDDIIHGYGRYQFLGGHKYEGDWSQGMKHGVGILEFASGDKYIGFFERDNFHGQGEYFYKNGDKFEGTFVHGKKNGTGKFLGANGRKIIGEWIDDQLQHF
ncbi:MORN motif protein (macronuclear) [Tetrahymena thermophila SB210]|uniref:MORN motif protein n=1 Tax=Tetrahymena thermophila (strain SB210) TaxID=312017 RepID=I7MH32_TETTS|nr:MORN motif protein [Tetrahymena thermophila SB210]EAS02453.3 MORN motif protein [Tetrahymena thermophila SB210]|eukprot:XP_001022698.3 MORN motif protein [Tetrahymena thermophila SB210]